ncbi:hypothetical protein SteCoe_25890 [Stentor coeruleus]|uniref:RING-CH-type domain-containing protein n=1 Tax=Stentor coeruleus TaxID=5963 RepID=A0A1R2BE50_9CILI|nr:hypothetical protein SteCoe_25890 [Stentor coeruleus]
MEQCRFCLEHDKITNLISPCNCIGSQKYIHQFCLNKWQNSMLDNIFTYPQSYNLSQYTHCGVCKSKYTALPYKKYLEYVKDFSILLKVLEKYWYVIIIFLIILALFSGFILMTFILNLAGIIAFTAFCCYWKNVRPRIFSTFNSIRVGFIRYGEPVQGITPGVIISATPKITQGLFMMSRILITDYSPESGAIGLIFNKIFTNIQMNAERAITYSIGGPVSPKSRYVIHNMPDLPQSTRITDGIYIGGVLNQMSPEIKCRYFIGCSCWEPYQLDGEIRAGIWEIQGLATPDNFFNN